MPLITLTKDTFAAENGINNVASLTHATKGTGDTASMSTFPCKRQSARGVTAPTDLGSCKLLSTAGKLRHPQCTPRAPAHSPTLPNRAHEAGREGGTGAGGAPPATLWLCARKSKVGGTPNWSGTTADHGLEPTQLAIN